MEWFQLLSIIVTLLGGIFYIHSEVREIRKDTQQQGMRIDQQGARIDKMYENFVADRKAQDLRTDKLYQMFIDLLKSKNTP